MSEMMKHRRYPQAFVGLFLCLALIASLAFTGDDQVSNPQNIKPASGFVQQASGTNTPNPELPEAVCENLQVVVLLDRSGSVVNQGTSTVQKYRDQTKKIWSTLNQVSLTYEGFTSGTLWAFAGRTANQMPLLQNSDNNGDGIIDEQDLNLGNSRVLNKFNEMTQNIHFSSNGNPEHPSTQPFSMGYNPNKEDRRYFTRIQFTNWHEAFLMAQDTVTSTNTDPNKPNHSIVLMITDGVPTVNDGPNHRWDNFARRANIDEQHDGSQYTSNHATRTREVVNALRQGHDVRNSNNTYDPVQVYGILIGGGSFGASKMSTAFGEGNWFQSQDFDSTIGTHILNVVANSCPPAATLVPELQAELLNPISTALEGDNITFTVDVTNTGTAALDNVSLAGGSVSAVYDNEDYSNEGILSPGQKRRFIVSYTVGAGLEQVNLNLGYSADVADDHSLLLPGSPTSISGEISTSFSVQLIPRPV